MDVKKINQYAVVLALLFLLTIHFFFDMYRGAAFGIMPNDNDYLYYLLYMVGESEGYVPDSPFVYRLFSVLLLVPFYEILPLFKFSGLSGESSDAFLKAQESLAFVSYCSTLLSLLLIFLISKDKFNTDSFTALFIAVTAFVVFRYTGLYNVDIIAISLICLIYYFLDKKFIYLILIFLSIGFNEKISLIFIMVMFFRSFLSKGEVQYFYFIIPLLAFLIFLLLKSFIGVEGNEHQTDLYSYIPSFYLNVLDTFNIKGIVLNLFPFLILLGFYYLSFREFLSKDDFINPLYFSIFDVIPLVLFFLFLHFINVQYNVGRILMYTFPFYLPLSVLYVKRLILKY